MSLGGWMAFILFVSAARADANAKQTEQMRRRVTPKLETLKRKDLTKEQVHWLISSTLQTTQDIMGDKWQPNREYLIAINAMIGKEG
jgi:hypothetical protein